MSKSKLTIADYLTIAGIVAYAFFTCIGFLFTKQLTMSVVWTLGYTAVLISMLLILKRIKKVEDNIKLFRIIEYGFFAVVALLLFLFINKPMERAFNMMSNAKETLKESAYSDLEDCEKIFEIYEHQEGDAIESTKVSLGKVVGKGKNYISSELKDYLTSHFNKAEYITADEVRRYSEGLESKFLSINQEGIQEEISVAGNYLRFKNYSLNKIAEIKAVIDSWSPLTIPFTVVEYGSYSIPVLGREIADELTNRSKAHNADDKSYKFLVNSNSYSGYKIEAVMEYTYSLPDSYKKAFLQSLNSSSFVLWPFLWAVLVDLFALMSYFMCYRSTKVEIMRQSGNGNIPGTRL